MKRPPAIPRVVLTLIAAASTLALMGALPTIQVTDPNGTPHYARTDAALCSADVDSDPDALLADKPAITCYLNMTEHPTSPIIWTESFPNMKFGAITTTRGLADYWAPNGYCGEDTMLATVLATTPMSASYDHLCFEPTP